MNAPAARSLAGNGALLIFAGLLIGLAVPAAPFPRLMLAAHIQFLVNGMLSVLAAAWQEALVVACLMVPALLLIAAWILPVRGMYAAGADACRT